MEGSGTFCEFMNIKIKSEKWDLCGPRTVVWAENGSILKMRKENCIIGTLEELSLHQEDIEKIEHINNWCRELQILYFQANLISKIENLNKLKKLEYLNLALNNIEKIENLERCESLNKLDLTVNFIGDIESVQSLKGNIHLRHLYLTGNPCTDFKGYRDYVIAHLPQLETLDSVEITKSDKIKAYQNLPKIEKEILKCQEEYRQFREEQKVRMKKKLEREYLSDEDFWKTSSENCPETRMEISRRQKKDKSIPLESESPKRQLRLFDKDGRPRNVNQAKLDFIFSDEDPKHYVLDIAVYKYLDTNLIEVDLQPIYVKLTVKEKIFQIVFPEEIYTDKSTCQRSQTTGHLVLKLPRVNYKPPKYAKKIEGNEEKKHIKKGEISHEYLEVEGQKDDMDFSKIVENKKVKNLFEDNPEVPPLEYC